MNYRVRIRLSASPGSIVFKVATQVEAEAHAAEISEKGYTRTTDDGRELWYSPRLITSVSVEVVE